MTVDLTGDREIELMGAIDGGSTEAFGELYDAFSERAYRVAFSVCRDDGRAQEAVQEAFISIWRNPAGYRAQRGTLTAWLLTVVRNRAIDSARRDGRHSAQRASVEQLDSRPATDDVSASVIENEESDRLQASLERLPALQREVITLAFYGQLSHTEIANELGLPAGTVKGRMRLGLEKLRDRTHSDRGLPDQIR